MTNTFFRPFSFHFVEEPYYGSGSGSGDGPDDEIEEGSGMSPIDLTPDTKHTTGNAGPSTTHAIAGGSAPSYPGATGASAPGTKIETDVKSHDIDNDSNNVNKINSNSNNNINNREREKSGAIGTTSSQMSLRRALITYFLPIYIAWFGGFFTELL